MKNRKKFLSSLIAGGLFLMSRPALAGPYVFQKYLLSSRLEGGLFTTSKNIDKGGNIVSLPGDNKFTENTFSLSGNYDWTATYSTFATFTYRRNSSLDPRQERTNTAPESLLVGGDYLLWGDWLNIIPEFSLSIPFYSVDESTDYVLLGNGATLITPKLGFSKSFKSLLVTAYWGYQYRGRGLSSLMLYGLGAYQEWRDFFVEGGLNGFSSISSDTAADTARNSINARVDAGSLIYNSQNPSGMNVVAKLGWRIEPDFYLSVGIDQSINGANTAYGTRFLIALGLNELVGGGYKHLGQMHPSRQNRAGEDNDNDSQAVRKKKFKVEPSPSEEQTPELEPFDVEIHHAKPVKKSKKQSH